MVVWTDPLGPRYTPWLMILEDERVRAALLAVPQQWESMSEQRSAAVLAAIFRRDGADQLLFTERRADLPKHPGQIAFPGGARDGEEGPLTCALRESHEEIGLEPATVTVLGALPNLTSSSSYRVHTIVGRIMGMDDLTPDPAEVVSIFAAPFEELFDDSRWEDREVVFGGRERRLSPHFDHGGHTIWGLTGRLTQDLIAAIRAVARDA